MCRLQQAHKSRREEDPESRPASFDSSNGRRLPHLHHLARQDRHPAVAVGVVVHTRALAVLPARMGGGRPGKQASEQAHWATRLFAIGNLPRVASFSHPRSMDSWRARVHALLCLLLSTALLATESAPRPPPPHPAGPASPADDHHLKVLILFYLGHTGRRGEREWEHIEHRPQAWHGATVVGSPRLPRWAASARLGWAAAVAAGARL